MAGTSITKVNDRLHKVDERYLYSKLRNPKPEIQALIRHLRIIAQISPHSYSVQKKTLPYIVCGIFNPPYRKKDNFAYTDCFILDIDHLSSKGLQLQEVRKTIQSDDRVSMIFTSPGGDGLKILFHLQDRCTDSNLFSLFYKAFAIQFSRLYDIEQVIDQKTSDVSRACFISVDPDVYYNPHSQLINIHQYIDTSTPLQFSDTRHLIHQEVKELGKLDPQPSAISPEPDDMVMQAIKEKLKLSKPKKEKSPVYVPEVLEELIDDLQRYIQEMGLEITEIVNIHYGKKIRLKLRNKYAEVNLFHGKRGFSVVISPRTGTDSELNEIAAQLITAYLQL